MNKKGMTLIELLVTMVIFSIAIVAFIQFFIANQRATARIMNMSRLYEEVDSKVVDFQAWVYSGKYDSLWNVLTVPNTEVRAFVDTITSGVYNTNVIFVGKIGTSSTSTPSYMTFKAVATGPMNTSFTHKFILTYHR